MRKISTSINKVVLLLTLSDSFSWGPLIIISSLSGIYLANKLGSNVAEFVGIGTSIYFITRAIFQIPIGKFTDKIEKDRDEIAILILGIILMGLSYLLYPLISLPIHYYIAQFIVGLGVSLSIVTWRKLFALNINKGMEGSEYAFYDTVLSIITAILGVVLGVIANIGEKYFDFVMIGSGIMIILSIFWVLLINTVKGRKSIK